MKDLIEKLNASDPVGKWIDDFVNSDDPKFKGKTKEERRKMAIGAYYGAQQNESVEDLEKDEDEENERKAKFKAALAATDQVAKGGMQKKGYTGSTYNPQKKVQKEEVELDEAWMSQRSSYDGPGKGKLLGDMSEKEHIDAINYHGEQIHQLKNGTHKYSKVYTKQQASDQVAKHMKHLADHRDAYDAHNMSMRESVELDESNSIVRAIHAGHIAEKDTEVAYEPQKGSPKEKAVNRAIRNSEKTGERKVSKDITHTQYTHKSGQKFTIIKDKRSGWPSLGALKLYVSSHHASKVIGTHPEDIKESHEPDEELDLDENIKVGDSVHVGHKIPGGSGYSGIVTKIDGEKIHFRSKDEGKFGHRNFVGQLKNAIKEEVEIEESMIANVFAYNLGLTHGISKQPRINRDDLDDEVAFNSYLRGYEIGIYGSERNDTEEYIKRHQMKPVIPTTNDSGIREEFAVKTLMGKTVYSAPTEVEAKAEASRLIRTTGKRHFVQPIN